MKKSMGTFLTSQIGSSEAKSAPLFLMPWLPGFNLSVERADQESVTTQIFFGSIWQPAAHFYILNDML